MTSNTATPELLDGVERVNVVQLLASDLPKCLISGHLSKATRFTLQVTGPFEEREGRALLKILGVQIEMLAADDVPF